MITIGKQYPKIKRRLVIMALKQFVLNNWIKCALEEDPTFEKRVSTKNMLDKLLITSNVGEMYQTMLLLPSYNNIDLKDDPVTYAELSSMLFDKKVRSSLMSAFKHM